MDHPPPPWFLTGELIVVPALVKPRALGGVMLADYRSGTLAYRELIVFSHATARGMVVSHIYVDDEQSPGRPPHLGPAEGARASSSSAPTHFAARQGDRRCWRRESAAAPAGSRC